MITEFGKWLKIFRIKLGIRLYDMSQQLGVSSAFLSAVERGNKSIPLDFVERIKVKYQLSKEDEAELKQAEQKTREEELKNKKSIQLRVVTDKNETQALVLAFARKVEELTDEDKQAMWNILKGGDE